MADALLGRVIWYELLTTDMKAAENFYTKVVGWTVQPFREGGEGQHYDIWTREGGAGAGGVMTIPPGMNFPPHWGMYIGTPNLGETVADIERRGGSALSPVIDVPHVGRMRTMKDPQGAVFSIMQPAGEDRPRTGMPQLGETSWHELYTTDAAAAMRFYSEMFGWRQTDAMDMGAMGKYLLFGREEGFGGGMMNKPPAMAQLPPFWGFYFRVANLDAAIAAVKANGGQVLNGPMEVPGGDHVVNCMDPQGAAFSLHHRNAA